MAELKACGFLVFRRRQHLEFLLMKHHDRWDLPKGHVDPGESEMQCALRELQEETGIGPDDIHIDPEFRFETRYLVTNNRTTGKPAEKSLVIFLAWLQTDVEIEPTEHPGFRWFRWSPPHKIQTQTVDGLLAEVANHLRRTKVDA